MNDKLLKQIKKVSLKCRTIDEFKNFNEYKIALENNLVTEAMKHMHGKRRVLTNEDIALIASMYDTISNFAKGDPGAYDTAKRRNIVKDVCKHMIIKIHKNVSIEKLLDIAKRFKTRMEFKNDKTYGWAYGQINKKYNMLDEACKHMYKIGSKYKRCIYVYEFEKYNTCYVGLTNNINKRHTQHISEKCYSALKKFCNENNIDITRIKLPKQLTDYVDIEHAAKLENEFIEKYRNEGWILLNKRKGGCLGGNKYVTYTKELCLKMALECKTITEFAKKHDTAYRLARQNNWNDIFEIFDRKYSLKKQKEKMRKYLGKPINQYNMKGVLLNKYNSIVEASEKTHISRSAINSSLKNIKTMYPCGYIFRYADFIMTDDFIQEINKNKTLRYAKNSKAVCLIKNNEIIKTFNSIIEASRETGQSIYRISYQCRCSKNKNEWCFKD